MGSIFVFLIIVFAQAYHPGIAKSFEIECSTGKRKRDDDQTIEESLSKKAKLLGQKEFNDFVVQYVIDGVLPISHVETVAFNTFMGNLAPGFTLYFFKLFIVIKQYVSQDEM